MNWPSAPKVLTALLVVLLPVLAFMQYRWVGQLSEASRERMQRNLDNAALQFRMSFDSEILRALGDLQAGVATASDGSSDFYSERYSRWLDTSDHPQIVANVFIVDADPETKDLRLRRWNSSTHVFELSLWPKALDDWRPDFGRAFAAARSQREPDPDDLRQSFKGEESFIVMGLRNNLRGPARTAAFGFTVIELDMSYLRGQMIPALVERHFLNAGGDMYRVAVTSGSDPQRAVYRSDPETAVDVVSAD